MTAHQVNPAPCHDCGEDTTPCLGQRGCRHVGRWEWYMVRDDVWPDVDGFLCIACLEQRLGRMLTADDFTDAHVNGEHPWDTARLAARKSGT